MCVRMHSKNMSLIDVGRGLSTFEQEFLTDGIGYPHLPLSTLSTRRILSGCKRVTHDQNVKNIAEVD